MSGNAAFSFDLNQKNFKDPLKSKINLDMIGNLGPLVIRKNLLEAYVEVEGQSINAYYGFYDDNGNVTWSKGTKENELLENLTKDSLFSTIGSGLQNISYLGNYSDQGDRILQKFSGTTSVDNLKDSLSGLLLMLGDMDSLSLPLDESLTLLNDIGLKVYLDKESGQVNKFTCQITNAPSFLIDLLGGLFDFGQSFNLENLTLTISSEVKNINGVEEFTIPDEALNAQSSLND